MTKDYHSLIIDMIKTHPNLAFKSNILLRIGGLIYPGYRSATFTREIREVKRVMNEMIDSGEIIFEPRKPLRLGGEAK